MKRWQLILMAVMPLTLALVLLIGPSALLVVPILWLLGHKVINSAAEERPLKATVRFVIAWFAAIGCSVVIQFAQPPEFVRAQSVEDPIFIVLIALCCLLAYWLGDTHALVRLKGVERIILRGAVSLILATSAAIGIFFAYLQAYSWEHRPIDSGWTVLGVLSLGFVLPFYATWELLPQSYRR